MDGEDILEGNCVKQKKTSLQEAKERREDTNSFLIA